MISIYERKKKNQEITNPPSDQGHMKHPQIIKSTLSFKAAAQKLADIINTPAGVDHSSYIMFWETDIQELCQKDLSPTAQAMLRVQKVLDWLQDHASDDYVPSVLCGRQFRSKFISLEAAIKRSEVMQRNLRTGTPQSSAEAGG
jgi:hypothetical protein